MIPRSLRNLIVAAAGLLAFAASADAVKFGPNDIETVFVIGKSDDGNQMQYGVHLDAQCALDGKEPVFRYWRELDKGPKALVAPTWFDGFGYGIDKQTVKADKASVTMTIKPAPTRVIEIVVKKEGEKCVATAFTPIAGKRAELKMIFIQLSGPLSVSAVTIRGAELEGGKAVSERVVQ